MFGDKKEKTVPRFVTRAEAFAYMLAYQLERGREPMDAAKQANEFADIFAQNMGLPTNLDPPPEGVDRYLVQINKVVNYCEEHPKVTEFVTGAATFFLGTVFGRKTEQGHSEPPPPVTPIDPNQLT